MYKKVAFLGAGSMTEAIISGLINKNFLTNEQIFVTNKSNQERLHSLQERYQIQCEQDKAKVVKDADIIILSMQPFDLINVVQSIKENILSHQLIISVAAGISTDCISDQFDMDIPIIRALPNMPASIGFSATALAKGKNATEEHIKMTEALFNTIGTTVIIDEKDMHTVTGLSGSGPAYIYYLAEAMEKAAIEIGMDKDEATALISQTFLGAGQMLQHSGKSAKSLKEEVISPQGTTEAGINTLMTHDFESAIIECIKNARKRSIELGEET